MPTITVTAERHLPYRCEVVYEGFLKPDANAADSPHKQLETRPIWGRRDTVGAQTILRVAEGTFDLEIKETILRIDRPLLFEARQEPLRYLFYDPGERVPPYPPDDRTPDAAFVQTYGETPLEWHLRLACAPREGGCDTRFQLSVASDRLGWFARRLLPKRLQKRLDGVMEDVASYLAARHG